MFGCLISPTGFQNVREAQGAFFKNLAKEFRFSAKNRQRHRWRRGNSFTIHLCLERFMSFQAWISQVGAIVPRHCQP
jgi:hypothetical protein